MSLIGCDIGSTGVKAVAFTPAGNIIAQAYREYPEHCPRPGWIELNPADVWCGIVAVLNEVATAVKDDVPQSLCMSSMGEAVTPVDVSGNFLYNTIMSADGRAMAQAESWRNTLGEERVFDITGMPLHPSFTINKLMWLRDNMPEVHAQTAKYLMWPDMVLLKLGHTPRLNHALAGRTMALDIRAKQWSTEMLETAGIDVGLLAEPIQPGAIIGEMGQMGGALTGFPADCLLTAGGHDQPMNALGAGVIRQGQAVDGMGTVECITTAFDEPVLTEQMRQSNYCCYPHVVPDMYCTLGYNYTSGRLLRWYRDNFAHYDATVAAQSQRDIYDVILEDLPAGPTGILVLPYLAGAATPHMDAQASGAILGLTLAADRKTMVKALIEGTCYELNLNLKRMAAGGVNINRLRATGGGSKSPLWLQVKADVTGREVVTLNVIESGCQAGAMLGGIALGLYNNLQDAAAQLVHERDIFYPNFEMHEKYNELYAVYEDAWPAIAELSHRLRT